MMAMRNYPGPTDEQRREIAEGLKGVLADTYTLYFKTHAFHWNVEGPHFFGLHNLFEQQYRELWNSIDIIAERIRALGHRAPASYAAIAKLSSIKERGDPHSAEAMIRELTEGHEVVMATIRGALNAAQTAKDEATASVLSSRLEAHEKSAWMLSSTVAQT
jgi:starvation-inducible DNA-binding protein